MHERYISIVNSYLLMDQPDPDGITELEYHSITHAGKSTIHIRPLTFFNFFPFHFFRCNPATLNKMNWLLIGSYNMLMYACPRNKKARHKTKHVLFPAYSHTHT